ncbi:restriction endonuclease [Mongoliitalea daihaiensis]|uniref:restriction endonuclease n=1 Tax=Mongoliitalea daihaiensis TaxID=2782006 RepID=UPI001F4119D3|nr:restriction endonuclease [Mongoliitalea daihaiensis]UJP65119.1 restriction endonuclease [Mongoliitalea daihaiensis]
MGIAKYLKAGKIQINSNEQQIEIADKQLILPFDRLKESDWGYVYEKYVGQVLEEEGFLVSYHGLEKGWLDSGLDLIATKDDQTYFIQCKYTRAKITKSRIEWILYKSSRMLLEKYKEQNKKLFFMLVVNNTDENFTRRKPRNFNSNFPETSKVVYPVLQYFLDHKYTQDRVKLVFREIPMIRN